MIKYKTIFTFTICLLMSTMIFAQSNVSFQQKALSSEAGIENNGALVSAYNFGNPNIEVQGNSVCFASGTLGGNSDFSQSGFGTGGGDFYNDEPSGALNDLLTGLIFQGGGFAYLTFNNLISGNNYKLQLFFSNDVNATGRYTTLLLGSSSYTTSNWIGSSVNMIVNFTATSSSHTLRFGNGSGSEPYRAVLNAYALHNLDLPDTPCGTIPKTLQTLTILGGFGNQGEIDPYTDASRDGGQTWQPAYLTGWHPWGFASGTNSWINFDPSPFVGLNSTADYRIRFIIPADFEDPSMTFTIKADNRAWLSINGTFISQFDGENSGAAGDQVLTQSLHPGLNEITIRLQDFGGWVGLNYRIDLSMYSAEVLSPNPEPSESSYNQNPTANAGEDQVVNCAASTGAAVTLDGSGSSDDDGDALSYSWSNGATTASQTLTLTPGSHTFTLTVNDGNGGTDTDDVTVTINADTEAPSITAPAAISVNANTSGGYSGSIGEATASDNCDDSPSVTNNAPSVFPLGETTVTWSAADANSNSASATQVVTVTAYPIIVDIKPGNSKNSVNPSNNGVIPVAIITNNNFDATSVDVSSLAFGRGHAAAAHGGHFEDVDNDGDTDLMLHFRTQDVDIQKGDTEICLTGATFNGIPLAGCDGVTLKGRFKKEGVEQLASEIPTEFDLAQNYPNPFNPSTQITVAIPQEGFYSLKVFNTLGQEVALLYSGQLSGGVFTFNYDASDLSTGIYIYNLRGDNVNLSRKMNLMK